MTFEEPFSPLCEIRGGGGGGGRSSGNRVYELIPRSNYKYDFF